VTGSLAVVTVFCWLVERRRTSSAKADTAAA
jgi:hypothetical protein